MHPAALVVMAILGCADAGEQCQQVGVARAHYVSVAECNAASRVELERQTDQPYPVIMVQCEAAPRVQIASAAK